MESQQSDSQPPTFSGKLARPPLMYRQWLLAGNRAKFFDTLVQDLGDFVHYRGLFSFYLVNHPSLVKQVLMETHKSFDKNSVIYDRFRNAFGNGLVVAEGERWRRARRLMQPLFGPRAVEHYFELMRDSAQQTAIRWEPICQAGEVLDVASEMNHVTLQIAGRALFHDSFDKIAPKISHWTHVINLYSAKPPLPIIRSFWFPSRINRKLKQALAEFNEFLQEMIQRRRGGERSTDLISRLLAARDEETGEPMSDQEIAEEALGMIIGGHETSSSALAWVWCELDQHPDVRDQLHQEIDEVIGTGPLQLEHIPQLVYTRMVIEEAIRLHPPFWFENRNVAADVELGGVQISKGSVVVFSRYSLHRHPGFWDAPEEFNPGRFRPGSEENKRSVYAYIPFGGGPRICIGVHFAMMELVVVLAVLARQFKVVLDQSHRHEMAANLTMTPKYGVRARLERRS
ncbi:Pentalenene oxygenase [Bremerella volcania]|uniref:Pentalenene oxygenase n=1 Tax=Bremerella volcania TaxID=2527984 RepID=A0A518CE47_9BACT|nr:cytochrome P450 [Bremerella volcania]QDU77500.1 Pentalenene oxygenase [Bremerella volcania]